MSPQEEVEVLMNEGIGFAEQLLNDHGEFFPFGVAMHPLGEIRHVAAYDEGEHPAPGEVSRLLLAGFRHGVSQGEYKATAIFCNVTLRDQESGSSRDAVQVGLDHESGYSVNIFFPYSLSSSGEVEFGELVATPRQPEVFNPTL